MSSRGPPPPPPPAPRRPITLIDSDDDDLFDSLDLYQVSDASAAPPPAKRARTATKTTTSKFNDNDDGLFDDDWDTPAFDHGGQDDDDNNNGDDATLDDLAGQAHMLDTGGTEDTEELRKVVHHFVGRVAKQEESQLDNVVIPRPLIAALSQVVYAQMELWARDLAHFTAHRGRTVTNMDDVRLLARKNPDIASALGSFQASSAAAAAAAADEKSAPSKGGRREKKK
ncbi:kinetochore component CENP-S-domain-containing protein [Blastocladiella britannica]|nr:kinetochore component CENP-S-domain-containing protein [Blastocladiella britannica]